MSDTFTCAACGNTYDKARTDEDAMAEAELLWAGVPQEEMCVICDDCFNRGIGGALEDFHRDKKVSTN